MKRLLIAFAVGVCAASAFLAACGSDGTYKGGGRMLGPGQLKTVDSGMEDTGGFDTGTVDMGVDMGIMPDVNPG
jgi:hypothetical protein